MTQIDVLKMAIEAGLAAETSDGRHQIWYPDNLCHFANLVAAKEREACALVVDACLEKWEKNIGKDKMYKWMRGLPEVIRARGEQA